jgi:hypothetical protein
MSRSSVFRAVARSFRTLRLVVFDLVRMAVLAARSHRPLAAENLFVRKQLALFQRKVKPRRADDSTRWMMGPNVPVAGCAGECEAGYAQPLAPQRISVVLALEIEAGGTTAPSQEPSTVDPRDGR